MQIFIFLKSSNMYANIKITRKSRIIYKRRLCTSRQGIEESQRITSTILITTPSRVILICVYIGGHIYLQLCRCLLLS